MQFYTLQDFPDRRGDDVYRESVAHKVIGLLFALAFFFLPIGILVWGHVWRDGGSIRIMFLLMSLFAALFVLLIGHTLRRACGPQNWVVRVRPGSILIKIRSYLNVHFPQDRPIIVELASDEIEWLGITRERRVTPTRKGVEGENLAYLDIKTKHVNLASLEDLLREERNIKVSSQYFDYPVLIAEGGVIRIIWRSKSDRVTPGIKKAVAQLVHVLRVNTQPETKTSMSFVTDPGNDRAREDMILKLAEVGDTMGAVRVARQYYGFSLSEARRFIEEMQGKAANRPSETRVPSE